MTSSLPTWNACSSASTKLSMDEGSMTEKAEEVEVEEKAPEEVGELVEGKAKEVGELVSGKAKEVAVSGKAEGVGDVVSEGRSGAGAGRTLMLWALRIGGVNIVVRTMKNI